LFPYTTLFRSQIRPRVLVTVHEDLLRPAHHVRVVHDAPAFDNEARTAAAADSLEPPRRVPNRLLAERHDLNDRAFRLGAESRSHGGCQQKKPEEILWHAAKMRSAGSMVKQLPGC